MKKWIAVFLSFCMLFGVTVCSTGERENAGTTEEEKQLYQEAAGNPGEVSAEESSGAGGIL